MLLDIANYDSENYQDNFNHFVSPLPRVLKSGAV